MALHGPPPARSEERRRTNEPTTPVLKLGPEELAALPFPIDVAPEPPDPVALSEKGEDNWHPYVKELWERLQRDPSRVWNGPAAMALDMVMCENLSRLLLPRYAGVMQPADGQPGDVIYERLPLNGSEMAAVLKWASARGLYEADRLRINKEISFYATSDDPTSSPAIEDAEGVVVSIQRNRAAALAQHPAGGES